MMMMMILVAMRRRKLLGSVVETTTIAASGEFDSILQQCFYSSFVFSSMIFFDSCSGLDDGGTVHSSDGRRLDQ